MSIGISGIWTCSSTEGGYRVPQILRVVVQDKNILCLGWAVLVSIDGAGPNAQAKTEKGDLWGVRVFTAAVYALLGYTCVWPSR